MMPYDVVEREASAERWSGSLERLGTRCYNGDTSDGRLHAPWGDAPLGDAVGMRCLRPPSGPDRTGRRLLALVLRRVVAREWGPQ